MPALPFPPAAVIRKKAKHSEKGGEEAVSIAKVGDGRCMGIIDSVEQCGQTGGDRKAHDAPIVATNRYDHPSIQEHAVKMHQCRPVGPKQIVDPHGKGAEVAKIDDVEMAGSPPWKYP